MRPDPQAYADVVVLAIKSALAPVLATMQAQATQLAELQQRVQDDSLTKELGSLRERVAVVEVKAMQPGPPGAPGKDGTDGLGFDDIAVDFDGERTMAVTFIKSDQRKSFPITLPYRKFKGPHQAGQLYQPGDEVLKGNGTTWVVTSPEPTLSTPGESKAWTMSGRGQK